MPENTPLDLQNVKKSVKIKSDEYDIRSSVVKALLSEGIERENIRIEIPLDTASSNGRADIVVLLEKAIGCIELKSGKDKFKSEDVRQQCERYNRAFDYCGIIVDLSHKKITEYDCGGGYTSTRDNWSGVDASYCHETKQVTAKWRNGQIVENVFDYPSHKTCVYDMLSILWSSEVGKIIGKAKGNKSKFISVWREEKSLSEIRPLVIAALRERPFNCWEQKFWLRFDQAS